MVSEVAAALKKTSKGNLRYDRSWLLDGRVNDILLGVHSLTCIHRSPKTDSLPAEPENNSSPFEGKNDEAKTFMPEKQTSVVAPCPDTEPVTEVVWDNCSKIIEYEETRKKKVQESVLSFESQLNLLGEQHSRRIEQQMDSLRHSLKVADQRRQEQITQQNIQALIEVKEKESKLKEHQRTHALRLNEKMKVVEERQRQLEEQEIIRQREQERILEEVLAVQEQLMSLASKFTEVAASWPSHVEQGPHEHLNVVMAALDAVRQLVSEKDLTLETVRLTKEQYAAAKVAFGNLQKDIANAKLKESMQKVEPPKPSPQKNVSTSSSTPQPVTVDTSKAVQKDLGSLKGCVDPNSLDLYQKLKQSMDDWERTLKPLETDPSLKKLQFEMKKAVNIPVNAISSQSGRQVKDKLDRLLQLLSGSTTSGPSSFSCKTHPLGIHFCAHLLAKKIVSQAENQVSSHQEAAFPLAAVTVGLWARFPKFGELLLAQLYIRCPYLVPIYHQPMPGQDEKEYHILLGYRYEDGEIEDQDQYLKRMGGIVVFYAALLQTAAPPGYFTSHPHGLQFGWQFLARLLNLRPRFDITATVLYHFLEVAGNALCRTYRKQMHKLLAHLHSDYVAQIRKVTGGESGGPISRLEIFLAGAVKSGSISPPEGLLTQAFWNT